MYMLDGNSALLMYVPAENGLGEKPAVFAA